MGFFDSFLPVKTNAPENISDVEAAGVAPYYQETS
jgi:hypothetical protein